MPRQRINLQNVREIITEWFYITRGVELESDDHLDEQQVAAWMKQVAAMPGVGRKNR